MDYLDFQLPNESTLKQMAEAYTTQSLKSVVNLNKIYNLITNCKNTCLTLTNYTNPNIRKSLLYSYKQLFSVCENFKALFKVENTNQNTFNTTNIFNFCTQLIK